MFAVVSFRTSTNEYVPATYAVIRYSWITEAGNKLVGPPFENGEFELEALKSDTVSRHGWTERFCQVLKYDIDTIKAANIERDLINKKETDKLYRKDNKCNLNYVETELGNISYCLERIEEKMKKIQEFIEKSPQSET